MAINTDDSEHGSVLLPLNIETKVDSPAKIAAVTNKPHNEHLFAEELNAIVLRVNKLSALLNEPVQNNLSNTRTIDLGEIGDVSAWNVINAVSLVTIQQTVTNLPIYNLVKTLFKGKSKDYKFVGVAGTYGIGGENLAAENDFVLLPAGELNVTTNTRPIKIIDQEDSYTIQLEDTAKYLVIKNAAEIIIPFDLPIGCELQIAAGYLNNPISFQGAYEESYNEETEFSTSKSINIEGIYDLISQSFLTIKKISQEQSNDEYGEYYYENWMSTAEYGWRITQEDVINLISERQNNINRYYSYSLKTLCAHDFNDNLKRRIREISSNNGTGLIDEYEDLDIEVYDDGFVPALIGAGNLRMYDNIEIDSITSTGVWFRWYSSIDYLPADTYEYEIKPVNTSLETKSGTNNLQGNLFVGRIDLLPNTDYTIRINLVRNQNTPATTIRGIKITKAFKTLP